MGSGRVRITDVAEAAGVSTATVSRVLAGGAHVRSEVRARVLATVARMGYRPNLVARSLRAQRSKTLGLVVSDIRNPFFTAVARAVEDVAYANGYSVLLCNTDEDPDKEAIYLNLVRDANAAGLIYSPARRAAAISPAARLDVPVVLIDRTLPDLEADSVVLDNVEAASRLTAHLIGNGYRRIGAVFGGVGATGQERRHGYEQALRAHGLAPAGELVRDVRPTEEAGYAAALELLDVAPPDAVLAGNSLLAAGALRALRERGLGVPRDLALVSFDEAGWETLVDPPITVMAQPTYEIGKTAAELLLKRLAEPRRPTRQVVLRGTLLARRSSARRRGSLRDAGDGVPWHVVGT